ncbi:MAG: transcriptional repressor LexA [Oscillospiraceae bacterium]|nr:transcriptional repressor LexA [Oscillospiraceae bacterium]
MKKLTKSQQKVFDFVKEQLESGVPPTVREICAATGLHSTSTVHSHLRALENAGYITRDAGLNRSIRIKGQDQTTQVPIVGRVTAGVPILAVEEVTGYLPFPGERYKNKELFALMVQGESMKNAGILDGDYVISEKTSTADDGEIVVALIEDEATVKRLYREKDCIRLQPENPDFSPIYSKNVLVLGKVVSVVRYY